jgi:hypothetical protein
MMRHPIVLRIWLPRLVISLPRSPLIAIRRPFYVFSCSRPYRVRTAPAVGVSMASYRADGAILQADEGVDLGPSLSPKTRPKRDLKEQNTQQESKATALSQSSKAATSAASPGWRARAVLHGRRPGISHKGRRPSGTQARPPRYFALRRSRPGSPPPTRGPHQAFVPPTTLCPSWQRRYILPSFPPPPLFLLLLQHPPIDSFRPACHLNISSLRPLFP